MYIGELIDAAQIKDKTLTAKQKVFIYKSAGNSAVPYGYVTAGQPVGVVYSYLDANGTSRTGLWWMFQDSNGVPYYTPHIAGAFDVSDLKKQGVLTVDEQVAKDQQNKDRDTMNPFEYYLKYYGKYILYGALGIAAVTTVGKGLINKI